MMKFKLNIQNVCRQGFLLIGFLFALVSLFFLVGGTLNYTSGLVFTLLSIILSITYLGFNKKNVINAFVVLGLITVCIFFSRMYIDLTFDGQAYHQEMMIQMSNGWNPIYSSINEANNQSIWVNHYSKAYEVIGSIFYILTGSIQSIKFVNLFILGISFLYPFMYFRKKYVLVKALIFSLIIALNPVNLTQLMTNLIDGFLYSITIVLFFSYLLSRNNKNYVLDFVLATILLINVKFTGVVFGVVIIGMIFLYHIFVDKEVFSAQLKKLVVFTFLTIPFLFSPYLKNTYQKGHPFYPLMGENNIDFVEDYVPDVIKGKNKVSKVIFSNFAAVGNRSDSKIKIPFTFTFNELQKLRNAAPRVGSFGVLWGGILLLSIIYYLLVLLKFKREFKFSIFELIIAVVVLLLLLNKAGWWLRYTPYFWLTPLLLFFSAQRYSKTNKSLYALCFLVLCNSLLILVVSLGLRFKDSKAFEKRLKELANSEKKIHVDFGAYLGNKVLFEEYQINFTEKKSTTFNDVEVFNNQVLIEKRNLTNE